MENMTSNNGQTKLHYTVPTRGLIGFSTEFMTMTKGYGILNHTYNTSFFASSFRKRYIHTISIIAVSAAMKVNRIFSYG